MELVFYFVIFNSALYLHNKPIVTSSYIMSKLPKGDSLEKPANKNIKNIYVHKINSLIKLSRDNIVPKQEANEMLLTKKISQKIIKKVYSETDKTALKLEKNRESARKARQRKNLYIKLLQSQVLFLRKQLAESEHIETSSSKYLQQIKNSRFTFISHKPAQDLDEVDRYLSRQNIADLGQNRQRNEKKFQKIQEIVTEFKNWFIPELMKSIINLKKSEKTDLSKKILRKLQKQFEREGNNFQNGEQDSLRLLLPFEQLSAEEKITNVMKILWKNIEQLKSTLEKVTQISEQLKRLIQNQQSSEIQVTVVGIGRIKSLINQFKICGLGDKVQKVVERILRWNEFPCISMLDTIKKIVQFDSFIEKTTVQEQAEQKCQQSQMDEQKQDDRENEF